MLKNETRWSILPHGDIMYSNMCPRVCARQCIQKSNTRMQEVSHHGRLVKTYREQAGLTQEELASLIGRSRRTIITLEQGACIHDVKVRRTMAWALQIPHELLGIPALVLPPSALRSPLQPTHETGEKRLHRVVFETLRDNLRMRLDL